MKKIITALFLLLPLHIVAQQEYRSPLDIPIYLAANFGELRPNHFHSGIDLKTDGVINKPVYAIEEGFVSRISVSPSGYGLAIYIDHPSGETSLCGHLEKFAPKIAEYVKEKQYEQQSFAIDIRLAPTTFPVKKGELVAFSGNTGSSMGPHVHFEIRETKTQRALDPLVFYKKQIKDTQPPLINGIALYPQPGEGSVNNKGGVYRTNIAKSKSGEYLKPQDTISAWGKIGLGISAIDKMDGTNNIYGVKKVRLLCDEQEVFSSDISSFLFEQSRMINSMIDFNYWYIHKRFYMKSFVEPANKLPIYKTVNSGYINIDQEKAYNMHYELEDIYGNKTTYRFTVIGKKQEIPIQRPCSLAMVWYQDNHYISKTFTLDIPKDYLYDNIGFVLKKKDSPDYFSQIYSVHDSYVPLNDYCRMRLEISKDTHVNKKQYGVVTISSKGGESWAGGVYKDGYMEVMIRELGHTYAVTYDNKAPIITPFMPAKWIVNQKISIKASDDKSGIASYKGTIDGEYVLFERDIKAPTYTYKFDAKRLKKGEIHKLVFTVTDRASNISKYESEFKF